MRNNLRYLVLFTLMCTSVFAQQRILVDGRAKVYKSGPQVIYLKNVTSGVESKSDLNGYFSVQVQKGDELSFWSTDLKTETLVVTPEIMESKQIELMLLKNSQSLEEIVIDAKNTKEDPLGLKMNKYTPTERQYRAESYFPFSISSLSLTPLINMLNGKRKMQKKMISYEKNDINFQYFKKFYTDEYLMKRLSMPKEYVNAFVYFVVEQPNYDILEWSNVEEKDFELAELAVKFKEVNKLKY